MFIKNEAAMKVGKYLVVSDVHIGLTKDLWESGVTLPSQVKSFTSRLNKLKKLTKTDGLIIIGDLKHKINGISLQEKKEVPEFLRGLKFRKIIIVKGNHDGHIEKLVNDMKNVSVKSKFSVGDYAFTHGHRKIKTKKKIIVIGHNHLCVRFRDDVKAVYNEPVWVRSRVGEKTIIIMPAFNELCGYYPANKAKFHGPVASHIDGNAKVYLLSGLDIGRIKDLKVKD